MRGRSRRPLRDPELPAAARPQWPPWYAPAALVGSGSLFAVIAIHAAFNTFAMLPIVPLPALLIPALLTGCHELFTSVMKISWQRPRILACLLVPRTVGRAPSPVPA